MTLRRAPLVAAVLLLSTPALAYLLPGWSLVRKTEARRGDLGLRSLQIQGTLLLTGERAQKLSETLHQPLDQGQLALPAVASFKYPGRCRIELAAPGGAKRGPAVIDRNGVLAGGPELQFLQPLLALSCPLLTSRGGDEGTRAIVEWMKNLGVDFQTTSLARFEGVIAEVIGADPREQTSSQVWIDKDAFVPLRVIAKQGGAVADARFLDLGAPGSGADTLPRIIELWRQSASGGGAGEMLARFTGTKADPNLDIDDALFDVK